jgi:uncharacterized repeat protein (TIGR03847 family)
MEITLNPCITFKADAIGKPGQRVFYLQATSFEKTVTLIIEKIQLQSLSIAIIKFLDDLHKQYPELVVPSGKYSETDLKISPPVDPLFRIGEISLAFDLELDMICLSAKEIIMESNAANTEDEFNVVNFWSNREQLKSLAYWGLDLVQRGRPICPLCQNPIDPSGHFCPKKNGHNKH